MDKIAANNHFVNMRKEIKKAKAFVAKNLIGKIREIKKEKEKLTDCDDTKIVKLDNKIETILNEIKLIKSLDLYSIAKQATLKPDRDLWKKMIGDSKATTEERLTARVIAKKNILDKVDQFRSNYKDCDEWLNEYIEYREKKKSIIRRKRTRKN